MKIKDRLKADLKAVVAEAQSIITKATDEGRDLSPDEHQAVQSACAKADGLKHQIAQHDADEQLTKALGGLGDGVTARPGTGVAPP